MGPDDFHAVIIIFIAIIYLNVVMYIFVFVITQMDMQRFVLVFFGLNATSWTAANS